DALDITPTNDNNTYVAPPSSDTIIKYVNTLGYLSTLRKVSTMSVNALYQPWRAILSMINMCLTGETAGYDRPRHPVLQILWGRILLLLHAERRIPLIHHLKSKHNIHLRTGSPLHYSHYESILNTLRSMLLSINNIWMLNMARKRKEEQQSLLKLPRRRTPMLIEASGHAESLSLDAKLPLTDSEIESDNVASKIDTRDQDEGQDGPNPGYHDEGQAGPNLGVQDEAHAISNPNLVIPKEPVSSTGTLSSLQNLEKELSFTDQFFVEKQQKEEPRKTNDEAEERLYDKFYRLETSMEDVEGVCGAAAYMEQKGKMWPFLGPRNVSSPGGKVGQTWVLAVQIRDSQHPSPVVDMKEILQQRIFKDKSYEDPEDHKKLYDALEKSLEHDYSDQLLSDLEEAHQKKKRDVTYQELLLDLHHHIHHLHLLQQVHLVLQVHLSDDEDSKNDHLPKAYSRKDWWKPLLEKERPTTLKPD
nr:hypothetical protein [Tanacetum cinerariifolium]